MNQNIATRVAQLFPYFVCVGTSYLFGYWGNFKINVLEFVSFSDLAKLAIYPLSWSISTFTFMVIFIQFSIANVIFNIIHKWTMEFIVVNAAAVLIAAFFAVKFSIAPLYAIIGAIFPLAVFIAIAKVDWIVKLLPESNLRVPLLSVLLILPFISYIYGLEKSRDIIKNGAEFQVDLTHSNLIISIEQDAVISYLGLLNGTFFLRENKTGRLFLIKQKDDSSLVLSPKLNAFPAP